MNKNAALFFLLLVAVAGPIFSITWAQEGFVIQNYSSQVVIITVEFNDDDTNWVYHSELHWTQIINGVYFDVSDRAFFGNSKIRLLPNITRTIVAYLPMTDDIPFMDKMKGFFKSLRIETEDGKKVITLENLGEQIIMKYKPRGEMGPRNYFLDIFDPGFTGKPESLKGYWKPAEGVWKPASEW
jgi:hypothetical protein